MLTRKAFITILILTLIGIVGEVALSETATQEVTADQLRQLQPALSSVRSEELAGAFNDAGKVHGFDPRLLAAVSFRESSLSPEMIELRRFGKARGEIGLLQCHGAALRFRPEACPRELTGVWCQVETGVRYLKYIRDTSCPGSLWRVLAAYGTGTCMSEREATHNKGVKNAIRYYRRLGGRP